AIPKAILTAVIVAVVYYVFVTWMMAVGFGNAVAWAKDPAALDTLATRYVGNWLAVIIDFSVAASGFIAALAGTNLTARTAYAIAICGYTLYKSIHPTPAYTGIFKWAPWVALIWLAIGVVIDIVLTVTRPDRVRAFGSILGTSEGPETAPDSPAVAAP